MERFESVIGGNRTRRVGQHLHNLIECERHARFYNSWSVARTSYSAWVTDHPT